MRLTGRQSSHDPVARRNSRLAVALASVAVVISLLGVTPGDAARSLKRVLNADRVDGLSASRVPHPGALLALDQSGRLPASVVPPGPRGPRGSTGPSGPQGPRGPSDVVVRRREGQAFVAFAPASAVDVATMMVPAGRWLVHAETEAEYFPNSSPYGDWFRCQLVVDGISGPAQQQLMGNVTGAQHSALFVRSQAVDTASTSTVVLRCSHEGVLPSGEAVPSFLRTTLIATRTDNLDIQDVTG